MLKNIIIILLIAVVTGAAGWYYWTHVQGQTMPAQSGPQAKGPGPGGPPGGGPQKMSVGFIEVRPVTISRTNQLPGRVVSFQVAEIRPQVSGIIQSRMFEEGSFVEEGQQLYQIDPERYEADLQMANANLQDAKARVNNAQNLADRFEKLVKHNAVSRQEYDDALAGLEQAKAAVALAEAEVRTAQINLDYTKVYAPISGFIGPSAVTKGALVTAQQDVPLATVRQLDPVYVDLSQAAAEARYLQERITASRLQKDDGQFAVALNLGNTDQAYPHKGSLDATDLAVDTQTGAIRLRSVFPNPDNVLLPGMFVRASIEDIGRAQEIIVPQKSVNIEPDGSKSVWIVSADGKAEKRAVQTGAAYQNNWIILNGLESGDRVIVEGRMMLREGAPLEAEKIEAAYEQRDKSAPVNPLRDNTPPPQNYDSDSSPPADQDQER